MQRQVMVHHPGRVRPFTARVSVLAMDLELALLVLEDEKTFWETPGLAAVAVGPAASPGLAVQVGREHLLMRPGVSDVAETRLVSFNKQHAPSCVR